MTEQSDREPNYRREKGDAPIYQGLSIDQWARQSVQATYREKTKEELEEKKPDDLLSMLKLLEKNGVEITPSLLAALTSGKQAAPQPEPEPEPEEAVPMQQTEELTNLDLLESIKVAADEIQTRVNQMKRGIIADSGVSISDAASNTAAHITTLANILIEREKTKTPPPTIKHEEPEEELTPQQRGARTRAANRAKKG